MHFEPQKTSGGKKITGTYKWIAGFDWSGGWWQTWRWRVSDTEGVF